MHIEIKDSMGKIESRKVTHVWVERVHSNLEVNEDLGDYKKLLDFGDYFRADEGCCDNPFNCDHEIETRAVIYFTQIGEDWAMVISYSGICPSFEHITE